MIGPAIHQETADWVRRVRANGGGDPSTDMITGTNVFVHMCKNSGIWNKLIAVNLFASGSLAMGLTPLLTGSAGNDPWTNNGTFAASALTLNGLQGNKVNFLKTGLIPTSSMTWVSWGVAIYVTANPNDNNGGWDAGCADNGGVNVRFNQNDSANGTTTNTVFNNTWNSAATLTGYAMGIRKDNFVLQFRANSTNAHSGSTHTNFSAATERTPSTVDFAVFGTNENNSVVGKTDKTFSVVAFLTGISEADSYNLYQSMDFCRKAMGGGYV